MSHEIAVFLIIYLSIIGMGIIFATILLLTIRKTISKLPHGWRKLSSLKNFQRGILFLLIYLLITFTGEAIALYIARYHHMYNSFIMAINSTLSTLFLFGFLFINTQTIWRRYTYLLLYVILVGYFISGGYYHPRSILTGSSSLVMDTIYFSGALVHLTELLVNSKMDYFRFVLKINLSFLVYALLTDIINSFLWYAQDLGLPLNSIEVVARVHLSNICLFYLSLLLIFVTEIIKLNRKPVKPSK